MSEACLVLIETSGNQRYVFDTNKRRENVGASELVWAAGSLWAAEELAKYGKTIQRLVVASGKVLVQVPSPEIGRQIVTAITLRALKDAPGLDIAGYVGQPYDVETADIAEESKTAHAEFAGARALRPGPEERFARLPIVAECNSSGLPAMHLLSPTFSEEGDVEPRSAPSAAKLLAGRAGMRRIGEVANLNDEQIGAVIDYFDDRASWLGLIHADGNGLGQLFFGFAKFVDVQLGVERLDNGRLPATVSQRDWNQKFIALMYKASCAVDAATKWAFRRALSAVGDIEAPRKKHGTIETMKLKPVLPLVLGGDDATLICDGRYALPFTRAFLVALEAYTGHPHLPASEDETYAKVLGDACELITGARYLTAGAGVAIVKPHYPFSSAYELSEELIRSAKTAKNILKDSEGDRVPSSAIDFHTLFESSAADLHRIRGQLEVDGGSTRLYARPYVVTDPVKLANATQEARDWASQHHWSALERRVRTLEDRSDDSGLERLPASQVNDLRAGLFVGKAVAEKRYDLLSLHYGAEAVGPLGATQATQADAPLFWKDPVRRKDGTDGEAAVTGFLDAIDVVGFLTAAPTNLHAEKSEMVPA